MLKNLKKDIFCSEVVMSEQKVMPKWQSGW